MNNMLSSASSFNQNLSGWNVGAVTNMTSMLDDAGLSTTNYDNILIGWSSLTLQSGVVLGASGLAYCEATTERQKIIDDFGWTINDAGIDAGCATIWNGSTWSNGTPDNTKDAIIAADYSTSTDGAFTSNNLTVNSGFTLTIGESNAVEIDGNLVNSGTILVQDNASFIQTNASPANSGTGTYAVEREAPDYKAHYNYWASPVVNTSISSVFGSTGRNFYTLDSLNQAWQAASTSSALQGGLGFIATGTSSSATTITRTFSSNSGFHSGDFPIPLYYSGTFHAESNWHLVGSPYPSGIDVNAFLTDNASAIENAVYLWSSDGNDSGATNADYAVMNAAGVVNAGGSGIEPTSAHIASCQGFLVQSQASSSLVFSNSQRASTNNTFQRTASSDLERLWLGVDKDGKATNELLLAFSKHGDEGKDRYDAIKRSANAYLSLYSMNASGERLAIQGLPSLGEDREVAIGIEAKEAGTFTFSIKHTDGMPEGMEVYLQDALANTLTKLGEGQYQVALEKGRHEERFSLRFTSGRVTGMDDSPESAGISLYASNGRIVASFPQAERKASIWVYDLAGRAVEAQSFLQAKSVSLQMAQTGIYVVRIITDKGAFSKKLWIKQ
jgi:hypothetical protein